jgi:hypothetical protein
MPHNLSDFIEVLTEKADAWRFYCICFACIEVNGRPAALLKKFPNKSERIKTHLKKCKCFKEKYPEQFAELFNMQQIKEKDEEAAENIETSKKRARRESFNSTISSFSQTSMYFYINIW